MRKRDYRTIHDINVTNLVDVVLVLLIVFMISAPLLQSGIEVKLPQTTYVDKDLGEGIVVTVMAKDSLGIFIGSGRGDDIFTGPGRFGETLRNYLGGDVSQAVYLRADKNVRWEFIINIIAQIKKEGVTELGLVTAPFEESHKK